MMLGQFEKKFVLIAVFCSLALFVMLPATSGYGTTMEGATVITNGTTTEQMTAGGYVYYKICCNIGDDLRINLTYFAGTELNFQLYSPLDSQFPIDAGDQAGQNDSTRDTLLAEGYYIIAVHYVSGTLPATIHLIVSGATGTSCTSDEVPGFEGMMLFMGLITATSLALILLKNRRVILP